MRGVAFLLLAGCADEPGPSTARPTSSAAGIAASGTATGTTPTSGTGSNPTSTSSRAETPPGFSLRRDEEAGRLTVGLADAGAAWDRLMLRASVAGTSFRLNGAATAADRDLGASFVDVTDLPDPMAPGEYLEFCGDAGAVGDVTYTAADVPTNTIMAAHTFTAVAAC